METITKTTTRAADILNIHRKFTRPILTPQVGERVRALSPGPFALLADLCRPHSWGAYIDTYTDTHALLAAARPSRDTLCAIANTLYYDIPPAAHQAITRYLRHETCAGCRQPIVPPVEYEDDGRPYHEDCWRALPGNPSRQDECVEEHARLVRRDS